MTKGIIIGIMVGIIFLGLVTTALIVINQKTKTTEASQELIRVFLKARDLEGNFKDADYILDYNQNPPIVVSSGNLSVESWTEITAPRNLLHLYCWNEEHYVGKTNKASFSAEELILNQSKISCKMPKIGNIEVTHTGDLSKNLNTIKLNITARNGQYTKLSICSSWSTGIISVAIPNQIATCDKGNWLNWSHYNATTKEYTYLQDSYYRCGYCPNKNCEKTEKCELVEDTKCRIAGMTIPKSYKNKVDACWYLGVSLEENQSHIAEFEIKTMENKNRLDFVNFIILDQDRRPVIGENRWVWMTEYNNINLGNKEDIIYEIPYITNES